MIVELPWPHRDLSPNSRCHWTVKARRVKAARHYAKMMTMAHADYRQFMARCQAQDNVPIAISFRFHPPSNRRRDIDNLNASMKSATDGIAEALGVNDHRFGWFAASMGDVKKPGCVVVTIDEPLGAE